MFNLNQMSGPAKAISCLLTIPMIAVASYLFWSGHESMTWVASVIHWVISECMIVSQADKLGFFVVLLTIGIPAMVPCFIYDFLYKKGWLSPKFYLQI